MAHGTWDTGMGRDEGVKEHKLVQARRGETIRGQTRPDEGPMLSSA